MKKITRSLCVVALLALVLSLAANGEEVVVKNDSVTDFGQAVIVGDFVEGEHAGARLTSPCDGTLVAVQIVWLEGTAGHGDSLEGAIHIYHAPSFPSPGVELALLEGPVLSPGWLNEYRYLDEAQSIPLNVAVSAGQEILVTLEFYNPTNVGNGGPSVVRDLDGCQSGRNVLYAIPGGWLNFCSFLTGDLAIRMVIDCPGVTGACCYASGICANDIEEADCLAEFGAVWYEGQTCDNVTCTARGACCRQGSCLQLVSKTDCQAIGGVYAGDGTDCADSVCVAGACCMPATGECVQNFEFQCDVLGGDFQGIGTTCDPNPCPQPVGACCFGTVCLANQTEDACVGSGGEWAGAETNCSDNNGDSIPDACESSFATGDLNCDGVTDVFDIDAFVMAIIDPGDYAAAYPDCDFMLADCNADDAADVFDIDCFVALIVGK
ncbi:MAG: hypothetical protein JXO22_05510 [Phycisphaerae bacterium]|nr:hypothetical protein [Phycisphaerae bacterium]